LPATERTSLESGLDSSGEDWQGCGSFLPFISLPYYFLEKPDFLAGNEIDNAGRSNSTPF
jgi:hypothetical protein